MEAGRRGRAGAASRRSKTPPPGRALAAASTVTAAPGAAHPDVPEPFWIAAADWGVGNDADSPSVTYGDDEGGSGESARHATKARKSLRRMTSTPTTDGFD